MGVILIRQ